MKFCVATVVDAMQTKPAKIYLNPIILLKRIVHFVLQHIGLEKEQVKRKKLLEQRRSYMKGFSNDYLTTTPPINYRHLPRDLSRKFDYFVTGSDRVWHGWKNDRRELKYFLLMFAAPSQRLTIAPSFGFSKFPPKYLSTYKKGLEGFKYLSIREERGAF